MTCSKLRLCREREGRRRGREGGGGGRELGRGKRRDGGRREGEEERRREGGELNITKRGNANVKEFNLHTFCILL